MNSLSNDIVRCVLSYITKIEDCQRIRLVCIRLRRLLPSTTVCLELYKSSLSEMVFITPKLITWLMSCINLRHLKINDCVIGLDVSIADLIRLAGLPLRSISYLWHAHVIAFFEHYRTTHQITWKSDALRLNPFRQNWSDLRFVNGKGRHLAYDGCTLTCIAGIDQDGWHSTRTAGEYLVDVVDFDYVTFDTCMSFSFYRKIFSSSLRRTMVMFRDLNDGSEEDDIVDNFIKFITHYFPKNATVDTIIGSGYEWDFIHRKSGRVFRICSFRQQCRISKLSYQHFRDQDRFTPRSTSLPRDCSKRLRVS